MGRWSICFIDIFSLLNLWLNKTVISGGQAVQMAKAGLKAIYLSGWQVAGDNNLAAQTYPDQSLYPSNSAPKLVERINNAFIRADQIAHMEGSERHIDYFLPIVADCEAGFGGPLNAFELTKSMVMRISSPLKYTLFFYKNVVFPSQAEYSYFSADFRLKIFLYYS